MRRERVVVRAFSASHEASIWRVHVWRAQHFATHEVLAVIHRRFRNTREKTMRKRVPRCAKIWAGSTQKTSRPFTVSVVGQHTKRQKVWIHAAAQEARHAHRIKEDANVKRRFIQRSCRPGTTCRHWEVRRMTSGDPKYHSGRSKKEYASPSMEFLAKLTTNARRTYTVA